MAQRLPFEEPFWSGKHPLADDREETLSVAIPPFWVGGSGRLKDFFGYQGEGLNRSFAAATRIHPLITCKANKPWWKRGELVTTGLRGNAGPSGSDETAVPRRYRPRFSRVLTLRRWRGTVGLQSANPRNRKNERGAGKFKAILVTAILVFLVFAAVKMVPPYVSEYQL